MTHEEEDDDLHPSIDHHNSSACKWILSNLSILLNLFANPHLLFLKLLTDLRTSLSININWPLQMNHKFQSYELQHLINIKIIKNIEKLPATERFEYF